MSVKSLGLYAQLPNESSKANPHQNLVKNAIEEKLNLVSTLFAQKIFDGIPLPPKPQLGNHHFLHAYIFYPINVTYVDEEFLQTQKEVDFSWEAIPENQHTVARIKLGALTASKLSKMFTEAYSKHDLSKDYGWEVSSETNCLRSTPESIFVQIWGRKNRCCTIL